MRAVIQRVSSASVDVCDAKAEYHAGIGCGFLILLGVGKDDVEADAVYLAQKTATLRIFEDADGKMNLSLPEAAGQALVVSNFTLYADCTKGRRPSFTDAASGEAAEHLYLAFGAALEAQGLKVVYGVFGAEMHVSLVNDGPVTILLDSSKQF